MRFAYCALLVFGALAIGSACGRVTSDPEAPRPPDGSAPPPDAATETSLGAFDSSPIDAASLGIDAALSDCGEYLANREVLEQLAAVGAVGVYTVIQKDEECSGLGGTHVTMELQAACVLNSDTPKIVHWGGHGCHTARSFQVGDAFVVGFEPFTPPPPTAGWCIDALPTATAKARWIDPVSSVEAGRGVLRGALDCPLPLGGP
jgi:hypothetical protein